MNGTIYLIGHAGRTTTFIGRDSDMMPLREFNRITINPMTVKHERDVMEMDRRIELYNQISRGIKDKYPVSVYEYVMAIDSDSDSD